MRYVSSLTAKSPIKLYAFDIALDDNEDLEIYIKGGQNQLLILVNSNGIVPDQYDTGY